MTLDPLHLLLVFVTPWLFGAALMQRLGLSPRDDGLRFAGASYVTGTFGVAVVTLVWLALGRPFDGVWLVPLVLVGAVALARVRELRPAVAARWWPLYAVIGLAVVSAVDIAAATAADPIAIGDEANIWMRKAVLLYRFEDWTGPFAFHGQVWVKHADYPLLNPLLHVWGFAAAGEVTGVESRFLIQASGLALLLLVAASFRRFLPPAWAALLVAWLWLDPLVARLFQAALADMLLVCAMFCAVDSWSRWRESRAAGDWALCAVACAAAAAAKNEGWMLVLVFAIALACGRALGRSVVPWSRQLWWGLLPIVVVGFHKLWNAQRDFRNDLFAPELDPRGPLERIGDATWDRWLTIVEYFAVEQAGSPNATQLILPALAILVLCRPSVLRRMEIAVPVLFVAGALCAYVLVFAITPNDLVWHLGTAAHRTVFHVTPVAALGVAVAGGALARRSAAGVA